MPTTCPLRAINPVSPTPQVIASSDASSPAFSHFQRFALP
jgi:hypothetical protein